MAVSPGLNKQAGEQGTEQIAKRVSCVERSRLREIQAQILLHAWQH
jgi:hypothetical protein